MKFKLILLLGLLLGGGVADAGALLKPTTGATQALRAKNLDVRAEVTGAFARTTATTTYANPNNRQIEADFIYTAPENATVTGFAYWFKGEKVVARVVEKERAAEIYQLFTVRRRDPALVEMIGKNTFRARIAPVEARADLKIEVQYLEPLAATKDGWRWAFPLGESTANYPLDAVNFSAQVADGASATSNFGEFKSGKLSVEKTNIKDAADIRLDVAAPRAPLKVSLFAARDSGSDGFFAIALAPDFSATKPTFAISGVQTYDVMRDDNARVGQTFVAVGRYRGAGEALLRLGKRSVKVQFPEAKIVNNLAAQIWGARRIETLSTSDGNRAAVINLSKRFGMPSKYTSWLALPASEKAAFERQLVNLEMNRAVSRWAQSVAAGDKKREKILRQRAYDYRVRLNKLNGQNARLTLEVFRNALNNELERVVAADGAEPKNRARTAQLKRNLRGRGAQTYRETNAKSQREYAARQAINTRFYESYDAYLKALQNGETRKTSLLLAQSDKAFAAFKTQRRNGDYDPRSGLLESEIRQLASQIETKRKNSGADSADTLAKMRRLLALSDLSEVAVLREAKTGVYRSHLQQAADSLRREVQAEREEGAEATRIKKRMAELEPFAGEKDSYYRYGNLDGAYRNRAAEQGTAYLRALESGEPQKAEDLLKGIKSNLQEATLYARDSEQKYITLEATLVRAWSVLQGEAAEDLAKEIAAKRENSPAAVKARELLDKAKTNGASQDYYADYYTKNAWRGRAHETAYRLIEARQNGDAKTVAALEAQLQIEAENAGGTSLDDYLEWEKSRIKRGEPIITSENYSLRPGDPLISVSAPENCQRVVAILPSGELLPLVYDATKKAWEARFDVPTYANEGAYKVQIIIVGADGARQNLTMTFHVDVTAPSGKGGAIWGKDGLNLQLQTDEKTDRVSAFTPWGARIELRRNVDGIFAARAEVPELWRDQTAIIRFVLTDQAHNRTEISVDWSR